jgi:hypothetical protein
MIFKQHELVLDGTKTQTRRVVKDSEFEQYFHSGMFGVPKYNDDWIVRVKNPRLKWEVGKYYAVVPKRGKPGIGRIRLTEIRRERLQDITEEDAKAEGCEWDYFTAREDYRLLWESINKRKGTRWEDNPEVWVLTFEVVEAARKAQGGK